MYKLKDYEREKVNKFIKFCCDARSGELKRRIKNSKGINGVKLS
ncbi:MULTISPECIES: hypothetical protein [Robinsoniella]|nr:MULTISPECIES: hypothetical protein [Robinsoniella]